LCLVYDPNPDPTVRLKGIGHGPLSDGLMHESDTDDDKSFHNDGFSGDHKSDDIKKIISVLIIYIILIM
jgi:hypothetical protein